MQVSLTGSTVPLRRPSQQREHSRPPGPARTHPPCQAMPGLGGRALWQAWNPDPSGPTPPRGGHSDRPAPGGGPPLRIHHWQAKWRALGKPQITVPRKPTWPGHRPAQRRGSRRTHTGPHAPPACAHTHTSPLQASGLLLPTNLDPSTRPLFSGLSSPSEPQFRPLSFSSSIWGGGLFPNSSSFKLRNLHSDLFTFQARFGGPFF